MSFTHLSLGKFKSELEPKFKLTNITNLFGKKIDETILLATDVIYIFTSNGTKLTPPWYHVTLEGQIGLTQKFQFEFQGGNTS